MNTETEKPAKAEPIPKEFLPRRAGKRDPVLVAQAVDRVIDATLKEEKVPASPRATDEEFLRRIYLDLLGRIPTYEETTAFRSSKAPDKRRRLIDDLLTRPEYARHFAIIWRGLIVPQVPVVYFKNVEHHFTNWLTASFQRNDTWDKLVTNLLTAEGTPKENPATIFFHANKDNNRFQVEPSKVVGSIGKLFMGISLSCAECHNHRFAPWKQREFWGMAAFFNQVREAGLPALDSGHWRIVEQEGVKKVFNNTSFVDIPVKGGAQISVPDLSDPVLKTVGAPVPAKFLEGAMPKLGPNGPYRPVLAAWLTSPENKFFARAAVNRWWAHFMTRGLVNPVDDMHEGNPPSHPAVLEELSAEFAASGFDLKHLIRCICNSQVYQRTSRPLPGNIEDTDLFSHMGIKLMTAETLHDSLHVVHTGKPPSGTYPHQFITLFANETKDPTELRYALPQFLSLMNQTGTAAVLYTEAKSPPEKMVRAIYLAVLSRPPTAEEMKKVAPYVAKQDYTDLVWALVNSAEFILNH